MLKRLKRQENIFEQLFKRNIFNNFLPMNLKIKKKHSLLKPTQEKNRKPAGFYTKKTESV